jgi:hypothetical protein
LRLRAPCQRWFDAGQRHQSIVYWTAIPMAGVVA